MNSCYKVRACCSAAGCDYALHQDVIRTINHESSFSFAMFMNQLEYKKRCPLCESELFYYPVTFIAEPVCFE